MKRTGFSLIHFILIMLSRMPMGVLYKIASFLYYIIYYLIGYRRKVVYGNLQNAFPKKTKKEIRIIEKKFYRYFCDLLVEIIKKFTISQKEGFRRCSLKDNSLIDKFALEKQSLIWMTGHYGNWEWGDMCVGDQMKHKPYAIYKPLVNTYFDEMMFELRSRFGSSLLTMNDSYRGILKNRDHLNVTLFIADQTPTSSNAYWTNFLNQDTAVFRGAARIAKKTNYPVIYVTVKPIKRGYYQMEHELLVGNPSTKTEEQICDLYMQRLEKDICEHPEYWLWTHKRWKFKRG